MKYCIIALPRSRSSILLETIQLHNRTKILGEDIGRILDRTSQAYLDTLKVLLEKHNEEPAGVMRLHPLQMVMRTMEQVRSGKLDAYTLLDFNCYNFKQYDKILFTYRESPTDAIASAFVATKLKKFTYKSESEIVTIADPFYFSESDYWHVKDYIQSIRIMQNTKSYLLQNNLSFEDLYYNDIPKYLEEACPGTRSFHVETHYDYRKLISNYDDITEVYKRKQNEIL